MNPFTFIIQVVRFPSTIFVA